MSSDTNFAGILSGLLIKSIDLGRKIKEDSKKAQTLMRKLENATNFKAVLEQEAKHEQEFLSQAQAFSSVILSWIEEYPEILKNFQLVLSTLNEDLKSSGFIIEKTFPTFSISFNKQQFEYKLENQRNGIHTLRLLPAEKSSITKKESKLITEIAEIISLEFHIQVLLEEINKSIIHQQIKTRCGLVLTQERITDPLIGNLHTIIVWWDDTRKALYALRDVNYKAIELDADAAKKLREVTRTTGKIGMEQEQLKIALGGLRLAAKLVLNVIPAGGFVSAVWDIYESRGLYQEARRALQR